MKLSIVYVRNYELPSVLIREEKRIMNGNYDHANSEKNKCVR